MSFRAAKSGLPLLLILLLAGTVLAADGTLVQRPRAQGLEASLSARVQNLMTWKMAPTRADGSTALQRARLAGERAPASLNAIVMMCDFSDSLLLGRYNAEEPGGFPPPAQSGLYYAAHDSLFFDHLFQDVADYYHDVSGGLFTFHYDVHPRVVNLPEPMSFYGNHPQEGEQSVLLSATVIDSLDGEIDFSAYDTFILVHAGAGEETDILGDSPEQIYSNYLDTEDFVAAFEDSLLDEPYIVSDDFLEGEGINQVLILPECEFQDKVEGYGGRFGSLGVYCFEVGLRLGMLSLSDFTPAGNPDSQGIGELGLMGYGLFVGLGYIPPHPCAYNKMLMGWLTPMEMDALAGGEVRLTPCEDTTAPGAALRVNLTGQEFWLMAYRQQDPDGSRIFSFPGDRNLNGVPDFYNASNDTGWYLPAGEYFDPTEDTREVLAGAEWDFFMSENSAREAYNKGAGSGVYIWHIDEGVIWDTIGYSGNLFNADPAHKAVDLEEADGIQDLDRRAPSAYLLGGDDDSFRGEGNALFGPHTRPDTRSATGVPTGVVMQGFSDVVLDSMAYPSYLGYQSPYQVEPDTVWGFTYADTISFEIATATSQVVTPLPVARRDLDAGVDLRGSHVLVADLGQGPAEEIVLTGRQGEVFVLDGDLLEFTDLDGNPNTIDPFAVGTFGGQGVAWNSPAAVGDVDGDGSPDVVLTGPEGLYAFDAGGAPLVDNPEGHGLLARANLCRIPPVLVPVQRGAEYSPTAAVEAAIIYQEEGESFMALYSGAPASSELLFNLGPVRVDAPPVYAWDHLFLAVRDTTAGTSKLLACDVSEGVTHGNEVILDLDLQVVPGAFPVLLGLVDPNEGDSSLRFAIVPGLGGMSEALVFDEDFLPAFSPDPWSADVGILSPLAPGGVFLADGLLGRVGLNGSWHTGWPVRPREDFTVGADTCAAGPLVANLVGDPTPLRQFLLPVRDGRIFAVGMQGEEISAWPVAGPARSAGTPALGAVRQSGMLDLVAIGTFARITGLGDDGEALEAEDISSISIYEGVAQSGALWPMWGSNPWRNGNWAMADWNGPPVVASGKGIVPGSHICYPNPLSDGLLQVRGQLRGSGRVRAQVYNLEGEEVTSSDWVQAVAEDPFTVRLNLGNVASGMYFCRLTAEIAGVGNDYSVVTFAVER